MKKFASCVSVMFFICACAVILPCGARGEMQLVRTSSLSAGEDRPLKLWLDGEADTNHIDVMLAFDVSAQNWLVKNGLDIENFSTEAIELCNLGLANTELDRLFTFRLAGIHAIGQDFSGKSLSSIVTRSGIKLTSTSPERLEYTRLQQLRDFCRADIVAILVDSKNLDVYGYSVGLKNADLNSTDIAEFAEKSSYCACTVSSVMHRYTLLHEMGHILGAGHDDKQSSSPGPQLRSYSSGYSFSAGGVNYTTVMGYTSSINGGDEDVRVRLPFFSSPDYAYNGVTVGTLTRNDNTRTLRETYALVANFRVATPLPGYEENPQKEEPEQQAEKGISVSVIRGVDETVSEGQEVVLNRFVTDQFAVQATAPSSKKVTVRVAGLPTGMKFSSKTGLVSGFPKKVGRYTVKVSATCKGEEKKTMTFAVRVNEAPSWLVGDYVGLVTVDGVTSLATLKVSTAGKVSFKCKCGGRSRTFSCAGFASEETGAYTALPSAKISSVVRTFSICLENRSAALVGGRLLQKPWSRKDITAPKIRKTIKTTYGDLSVKISTKGKASFSGKVNGVRVSGSSQVVASFDGQGIAQLVLPIALDAKKNFSGIFEWATIHLGEDCAIIAPND